MIPSRSVPASRILPALMLAACLAAGTAQAVVQPRQQAQDLDRLAQNDWLQSEAAAGIRSSLQRSPAWVGWAQRHPAQTLLVVVVGVMIVATNPELFLFFIFTGYALSGPVRRLVVGRTVAPEPAPATES